MKYLLFFVFNAIALYILAVFIFGTGGMIDNLKKLNRICMLEELRAGHELDLEAEKTRLNQLRQLKAPDSTILAGQGKKADKTIIFKFVENRTQPLEKNFIQDFLILSRIYFSTGIVVLLILTGNIVLFSTYRKRTAQIN